LKRNKRNKQSEVIKLLLDAGANINLINKNGESPWSMAKRQNFNNTNIYDLLNQAQNM